MRNYDTPWQCSLCTYSNDGGAHPVDDSSKNPHRCLMCEASRPLPPREVVPHVHDDNVIPTVGGDDEFRGIDNDDDQFNLDAAIAASLDSGNVNSLEGDSGNVNALEGHCVKRGCRNVPHSNGLCVDCLILEFDVLREELEVANQMISYLQKELGAAVGLTEMGSSTVFPGTCDGDDENYSHSYQRRKPLM